MKITICAKPKEVSEFILSLQRREPLTKESLVKMVGRAIDQAFEELEDNDEESTIHASKCDNPQAI